MFKKSFRFIGKRQVLNIHVGVQSNIPSSAYIHLAFLN